MRTARTAATLTTAVALAGVSVPATAEASVSSIAINTAVTKPVRQTTYAWGTVFGGAKVQACTQVLLAGGWSTSQCRTTDASGGYTIPLTYGASTAGVYTWRVVAGGVASPSATLTRTNGSAPTAPKPAVDYIKGRTTAGIPLQPNSSTYAGDNGVKVYLVQQALGLNPGPMDSSLGPVRGYKGTMWSTTIAKIKSFQATKGLPQTGGIDAQTFYAAKDAARAGALIKSYDFDVDSLVEPRVSTLSATASHDQKVAAMITWATGKKGSPYIWGGTGPMGYDCSGFLLQALRAGGYNPTNVSNATDVQPPSRLSNAMYYDPEFTPVALNALEPGDFVYYADVNGLVGHVSMYVGTVAGFSGPQVLNAIGSQVQYSPLNSTLGYAKKIGANRMPG